MDLTAIRKRFKNCSCGREHDFSIKEIATGSGITTETGEILKRNGFS